MTPHKEGDQAIHESLYTTSIKKKGPLSKMLLEYSNKPSKNLEKTYFTHDHCAQHDNMLSHLQFAICKK